MYRKRVFREDAKFGTFVAQLIAECPLRNDGTIVDLPEEARAYFPMQSEEEEDPLQRVVHRLFLVLSA